MPILISLERLVAKPGTEDLWPEKFATFTKTMEQDPDEMTAWLALADWLKEHDEHGLEQACRYVANRQEVSVATRNEYGRDAWYFKNLPASVLECVIRTSGCNENLAGLIAILAGALRKHREEGE